MDMEKQKEKKLDPEEPKSMVYRLWKKSRDLLKKEEKEGTDGQKPQTEEEAREVFLRESSVDPQAAEWLRLDDPEKDYLALLWQSWEPSRGIKPPYDLTSYLAEQPADEQADQNTPQVQVRQRQERMRRELEHFHLHLQQMARLMLDGSPVEREVFQNACMQIHVTRDLMNAWLFVFPPQGGDHLSAEQVGQFLEESGVVYGVDWALAQRLVEDRIYLKILPIARGRRPVDGTDGELIECIPHETILAVSRNADGSMDYKSSSKTHLIKKGDPVYKLVPPGEPRAGVNLHGAKIPGHAGMAVNFPRIANTMVSSDGYALLSAIDGHIYYENNNFVVEALLVIDGNVDATVGNLDYEGDILVEGDVLEGFTVKATGNISVNGMVENAVLYAGGNITVAKGANGNGTGVLEAEGEIRAKFLENCIAKSSGDIYADSIIWSQIFCRGSLYVQAGRGVIIGGSLVVERFIEVDTIGNASRRPLTLKLGMSAELLARRDELEEELATLQKNLLELSKNLEYLETKDEEVRREKQYAQMKLQKPAMQIQERHLLMQLEHVYTVINDPRGGTLRCGTLYPPVHIEIDGAFATVQEMHTNALVYKSSGGVVVGNC